MIARVSGIGILIVGAVAYLLQILGNFTYTFFSSAPALVVSSLQLAASLSPIFLQLSISPYLLVIAAGIALIAIGKRK